MSYHHRLLTMKTAIRLKFSLLGWTDFFQCKISDLTLLWCMRSKRLQPQSQRFKCVQICWAWVRECVCLWVSERERERERVREDEEDQEKLPDNFKGAEMGEEGWIFAAYFRAGKKNFFCFLFQSGKSPFLPEIQPVHLENNGARSQVTHFLKRNDGATNVIKNHFPDHISVEVAYLDIRLV